MKISCVIFDWAGTTVDYGCFAPLNVFLKIFEDKGITISIEEARRFMGMEKREHIREITKLDSVKDQWISRFGKECDESDIDQLFFQFEPALLKNLHNFGTPIEGVVEAVNQLKERGIAIGSTTGYNDNMISIVAEAAKENGYQPDSIVTAVGLPKGRPAPYMIFRNMEILGIESVRSVLKVGDTIADIKEGKNSGAITVGVIYGSSEMALSEEELSKMKIGEIEKRYNEVKERYLAHGADYTIDKISDITVLVDKIDGKLKN